MSLPSFALPIENVVARGELAGAVALVWREDAGTSVAAVGWKDVEARVPLAPDDRFRIASMTKPITSTAALMLLEEGRFALGDAITRWAPELARMRVLRSTNGSLDTEPALRPITFEDLLTHRSGLTYADFAPGALRGAYREALGADIDSHRSPDQWIEALGTLPLVAQPGTAFQYGHSTDLLGLILARMEDAPLGDVLERRIFRPLGMKNTGFTVPADGRARTAGTYGFDAAGRLAPREDGPGGSFLAERPAGMTFVSGGQGLWSTAPDYLAFARMFVGGGSVDGVRVLRPETLALLTTNRLTDAQRRAGEALTGIPLLGRGHGFGLGVAVVIDPASAPVSHGKGSAGTVSWPGAFGGWWQADPGDRSVFVFLSHNLVELDQLLEGVGLGVHEAIEGFHEAARATR